ncbi:hypothetical protein DH2020_043467 [Rehmannia glutinosa]|uniref:MHD1 domain-containing protein n=1 Tax=Rehmannia glutinosa TaxID=99300 RepID=A0ABR0UKG8_REHGL
MGRHFLLPNNAPSPRPAPDPIQSPATSDLLLPFGKLDGLDRDDYREAAYEVFFTACRSSPGFGGRSAITYYNSDGDGNGSSPGSPVKPPGVGMAVTSRIKRALGLKMMKRSPSSRRASSCGSNPSSPSGSGAGSSPRVGFTVPQGGRLRRPMTSAEIMRQQMRVTEQSDNRLRKTLMRTLVGQASRDNNPSSRASTTFKTIRIQRSPRIPSVAKTTAKNPRSRASTPPFYPTRQIGHICHKNSETSSMLPNKGNRHRKNSSTMRTLCNCIASLAWRSPDGGTTDVCHWADGYPQRPHLHRPYVLTGQTEPDLLGASFAMLTEVANDAKKVDREPIYMKMLASVLSSMKKWCDKRLLDYHGSFNRSTVGLMENMLPLLFSATKIMEEDVPCYVSSSQEKGEAGDDSTGNRVDYYIRSSLRNAFAKMLEDQNINGTKYTETQEVSEVLIKLAKKTEELGTKEKEIFSPVLKKWHPVAAGVAAVTLHTCYGTLLKQYLTGKSSFLNETVLVLQRAGKLEKFLVQLVVEDSVECEDGGKAIVREMVPYEVDSMILRLLKQWIHERLQKGREHLLRAKQTETWNPKSKTEPYAHSAVELVSFAKEAVENFFEIPVNVSESLFYDFVDGLENIFRDYIAFVASCGSKQSYLPTLPPLTRCSRDSKLFKLWRRAACSVGVEDPNHNSTNEGNHPRPQQAVEHNASTSVSTPYIIFLYVGDVENARIRPAIRLLKQNLTLLCAIVTDRAQPLALKEVMKASFEAFLMVLLAGGSSRMFSRLDHPMIEEDFDSLKRVFVHVEKG